MTIRGLDAYITGHWGEDQFRGQRDEIEDEGLDLLNRVADYFAEAGYKYSADDEDHAEAMDILSDCMATILEDYTCRFCGNEIGKKNTYCSKNCYKADNEGI